MNSIQKQITSYSKLLKTKMASLKKVPARYIFGLGVLSIVTVGMLMTLVASRQTTEDRSQAIEGGTIIYLTKPADPMNVTSFVLPAEPQLPATLPPVTDIQVMTTAGRPIVSFSFVAQLRDGSGRPLSPAQADAAWQQFNFTFNSKIPSDYRVGEKLYTSSTDPTLAAAKLFAGTIGQVTATATNTVWNPTLLGSFTFTPVRNQPDIQLTLLALPNRPEANALYQKGSAAQTNPPTDGEQYITADNLRGPFSIRNPFYVDPSQPSATPTITPAAMGDVGPVPIKQLVSGEWQNLPATFDFTDFVTSLTPEHLRTEILATNVAAPTWWNESTSVGFRMRIKDGTTGNYKNVIPPEGAINPNTTELVQWHPEGSYNAGQGKLFAKWKVTKNPQTGVMYVEIPTTLTTGAPNPANPGQKLEFKPGDSLEVRVNIHIQNFPNPGVSRTCKVGGSYANQGGTIVEAPIGNPASQVELGPCRNNSLTRVTWPVAASPTPTATLTPTATITPTVTITPSVTATPTLTPTPTPQAGQPAFTCPSFSIDPALTWPMPVAPYDITTRELTVFTFDSTAAPAVRRWARMAHDSTGQVACSSNYFEMRYAPATFSNRVIGKLGLPDPVTGAPTRCLLQSGVYRLQVQYELEDGTISTCRSFNSLTVQPNP